MMMRLIRCVVYNNMIGLEQLFSIIPSIAGIFRWYTFRMHGFNFRIAFCTHACMHAVLNSCMGINACSVHA